MSIFEDKTASHCDFDVKYGYIIENTREQVISKFILALTLLTPTRLTSPSYFDVKYGYIIDHTRTFLTGALELHPTVWPRGHTTVIAYHTTLNYSFSVVRVH